MLHLTWPISLVAAVAAALSLLPAAPPAAAPAAAPAPKPLVVVELFTSEGCSSCPPADALLRKLAAAPDVDGAQVVALGFHIDYWDSLGWRDPFSSPHATDRQRAYADSFHLNQIYTPQMVVNGSEEFVGSDERRARSAIAAASKSPLPILPLSATLRDSTLTLTTRIPADVPTQNADLFLLVTESNLSTEVRRGENAGRHLDHAPVVRRITRIPTPKPGDLTSTLHLDPTWKTPNLRLVALLQSTETRHLLAAATAPAPLAPAK